MAASAVLALLLASALAGAAAGGDIVHQDDQAPKIPGCSNDFVLVKVQSWVGGHQGEEFVGVGARFGPKIVSKEKQATREPLTLADPIHGCAPPKTKVNGGVLLVDRGKCKFTNKAKLAEAAGASGILIINSGTELYKMVCEKNETELDIHIPAVLLPKDAGQALCSLLTANTSLGPALVEGATTPQRNQSSSTSMPWDGHVRMVWSSLPKFHTYSTLTAITINELPL